MLVRKKSATGNTNKKLFAPAEIEWPCERAGPSVGREARAGSFKKDGIGAKRAAQNRGAV
jgi:hypothetical protein